jgi:glucose/arabinose dehydrogenase
MIKYGLLLFSALLLLTFCHRENSPERILSSSKSHFKKQCAACHGASVEDFTKKEWKYGNSRLELINSIKNGVPGIVGHNFSEKLNERQIFNLSNYLLDNMVANKEKMLQSAAPKDNKYVSEGMTIALDTILTDLENPWGIVFLPNNDMLFTERIGKLWRLDGSKKKTEITGVPPSLVEGQGGLLDIKLHPKFETNQIIYLTYSKTKDSLGSTYGTTAVYRARLDNDKLVDGKDIFVAQPYTKAFYHYGGRLAFDRNGYMYVSVGDRGGKDDYPQFLDKGAGKIHRIKDDGSIPADNPFINTKDAMASVWSYGHRNPQGLAIHPQTGELWETEHGPRGGDEVNLIQKGKNFGWPVVSYGTEYDGGSFTSITRRDDIINPLDYWVPSIAPCGLTFVTSDLYPAWKGDLLAGSLRFRYLDRCDLEGSKLIKHEQLLPQIGRMRCITTDNEGYIYVAVEEPGMIFRLMPQ